MALFGVRVNGNPRLTGGMISFGSAPAQSGPINLSNNQFLTARNAANTSDGNVIGLDNTNRVSVGPSIPNIIIGSGQDVTVCFGSVASTGFAFVRSGSTMQAMVGDSSTTATFRVGTLSVGQAASTFAQTATITNGPRAANPVTWIEVKYGDGTSTGRVPVW